MRFTSKNRWLSFFLFILTSVTLSERSGSFAGVIGRDVWTNNVLDALERRIQWFVQEHHKLPEKLSDLPVRPDYSDTLYDGWDKPVIYRPQKDGSVILTSLGEHERDDTRSIQFSIIPDEERVGNEQDTKSKFESNERFIRDYAKTHTALPTTLDDLPSEDRDPWFRLDGWEKPIEYKVSDGRRVTLTSRGENGKQIFGLQFIVPPAKDPGKPLTKVEREKLQNLIQGKYTASLDGTALSLVVSDKAIEYLMGKFTKRYQYTVIGASGSTLVVQLAGIDGADIKRITIDLEAGGELQFNGTNDPNFAHEWKPPAPQKKR